MMERVQAAEIKFKKTIEGKTKVSVRNEEIKGVCVENLFDRSEKSKLRWLRHVSGFVRGKDYSK